MDALQGWGVAAASMGSTEMSVSWIGGACGRWGAGTQGFEVALNLESGHKTDRSQGVFEGRQEVEVLVFWYGFG
ncbi:hypothetical protein GCM10009646_23480 [Streptomyces aureus]